MSHKDIIENWAEDLSKKLGRPAADIKEKGLSAYDFSPSSHVEVTFLDKSFCKFKFAFCVINEEKRLVAVFTEHCGYHVYSTYGAIVREISEEIFIDEDYEE